MLTGPARPGKRPRSGSANQAYGPRRQLRMLNGRIYGAKRSNLANTNLFATARYEVFSSVRESVC